jgi:hypothetical protein
LGIFGGAYRIEICIPRRKQTYHTTVAPAFHFLYFHFYKCSCLPLGSLEDFTFPRISTSIHGFPVAIDQIIERLFISYIYQQRTVSPPDLRFVGALPPKWWSKAITPPDPRCCYSNCFMLKMHSKHKKMKYWLVEGSLIIIRSIKTTQISRDIAFGLFSGT